MRLILIIPIFSYLLRRYSFLFYRGKLEKLTNIKEEIVKEYRLTDEVKSLAHFLPRRYLHFLTAHNSRKIKNKIGCRFFASFECAMLSKWFIEGCKDLSKSVQFLLRQNQTYRETLPCNSYAFTG